MPLWTIHTATGTYTADDKRDLARAVTGFYTRIGLPAFYVVTVFEEHDRESFLIGGEPAVDAVRFVIEHIAVHSEGPEQRRGLSSAIHDLLAPFTTGRGLYSEFHVDETPRELWWVDGHEPPPFGSAQEKRWAEANRPVA
ncbi:tautomerase family protein [Nocardioides alkalitolerans]|uniref:tautomerase family protein n=1 Tax=Nocardioides alkalitolerans TaxID=281714 RepID=UPI0003FBBBE5|nr:tautomerase family protein [Nocardioides alkalitolerans]